jgi:pyruvate formate lyase activating enzyme
MNIRALQKTSLIDYPPYTVSVVFTGGCSFRCPFCHNPDAVLRFNELPEIKKEDVLKLVSEKKQWIDGVCISGGEPCMQEDLPDFCSALKELNLRVKLDTNGSFPDMLRYLIENKLVDYIAMDIKASKNSYDKAAGVKVNMENIEKSIELIKNSGIDYEFRTTAAPEIINKKEIFKIAKWLTPAKRYCIQQFRNTTPLIDNKMQETSPYKESGLKEFAEIAKPYFDEVILR